MGFFRLKEHATDVKKEMMVEASTFLVMLQIIPVMSEVGMSCLHG